MSPPKQSEHIQLSNTDIKSELKSFPPQEEDAALIRSLNGGDHLAYDKIFLKYYDRSIGFVRSLVHRQEDAEDLVEEVFVALWVNREQLDPSKNFNSYLYTVIKNAVFNYFRSQKVRANYLNGLPPAADQAGSYTDEEFIAKETELLIKLTVSGMPGQRRKIFELRHQAGMSNAEIAQQLGISVKAVEKQLRLALSDIRKVVSAFLALFFLS